MKSTPYFWGAHILLLVLTQTAVLCETKSNHTVQPIAKFPDLFQIDDYYKCPQDSLFCTATLKLIPNNTECEFWKQIEDWSKSHVHYNRTVIYRVMCIPKQFGDDLGKRHFVESRTNENLAVYNLSSEMLKITCMEPKETEINIKLYMTLLAAYLGLMFVATIYDETLHDPNRNSKLEKLLLCFSVTNYKKSSITKTEDYRRLKCMQGIRMYQTILVISGHVLMTQNQKNLANPELVEQWFKEHVVQYVLIFSMSVLQTYFFMSTWLLTYQIFAIHKQTGRFTLKDAGLMVVHRLARIWPTLLVMIFIGIPLLNYFAYGPGNYEPADIMNRACAKNWWVTFLLATNFLKHHEMCHLGMWSLSIDSQFYLITIIFMYMVLNWKVNIKKGLAFLFLVTYAVNVVQIYEKELGFESWINLKLTTNMNFFYDKKIPYIYYGFWINSSSSVIGILFGYIYFRSTQGEKKSEPFEKLYLPIFLILPTVSVMAAYVNYNRLEAALLGALFKPVFSLGIATGIYGISRNVIKGYVKTMCENKYAVLLGNFTFCTYVFHFFLVFGRGAHSSTAFRISEFYLVLSTATDIIVSFILGIIMTVTVEVPSIYIKKLILPPVWKKSKSSNDVAQVNGCSKNKQS